MTTPFRLGLAVLFAWTLIAHASAASSGEPRKWDRDIGKPAPELTAAAWIGTPVSLATLRGNTVAIVFWNADVPC